MQASDVVPSDDVTPGHWLLEWLRSGGHVRDVVPAAYEAYICIPRHEMWGFATEGTTGRSLWLVRNILARHTMTPQECWFTIWEGWPLPRAWQHVPKLHLPYQNHYLFKGALDDLGVIAGEFLCAGIELGDQHDPVHLAKLLSPTPAERQEEAAAYRLQGQFQDPSMWWPEDRAWVAAADVDSDDMYVAGSPSAIAELLEADLEAYEVSPDDAMTVQE